MKSVSDDTAVRRTGYTRDPALPARPFVLPALAGAFAMITSFSGCSESGAADEQDDDDDVQQEEVDQTGDSAETDDEPAPSSGAGGRRDAGSARADTGTPAASSDAGMPVEEVPLPPPIESDYDTAKSLIGSYAAQIRYRDVVTVGIAGSGSLVTNILATAELRDDPKAEAVSVDLTLCRARTAAEGGGEKHVLDLVLTVPPNVLALTEFAPPTLLASKADGTLTWQTTETHGVAGWKSSSAMDALPTSETDPRVVDQDDDGNPGVTATFTGHSDGSVYLAMVYRLLFTGTQDESGNLVGATTSRSRESMLGSTEILLTGMTIDRVADANTEDNTVRLVRQSSALTCEQLLAQEATLFP